MKIYYEPVNLLMWNIFEEVRMPDHIEPFLAVKSMEKGDIMLLHVGAQVRQYESGIYAVGVIEDEPYILTGSPEDYCNNKLTVNVRIMKMTWGSPYMRHEDCLPFIHQFRTPHKIDEQYTDELMEQIALW